jgi:hypothetical protein
MEEERKMQKQNQGQAACGIRGSPQSCSKKREKIENMEEFEMKHIFLFDEITRGRVIINSEHTPSKAEIIEAINNGDAYYHETKYGNIRLDYPAPKKEKERGRAR